MRSSAPSTREATPRCVLILHPFLMLSEAEAAEARRVIEHLAGLVARGERWVAPGRELAALVGEGIRARLTVVRRGAVLTWGRPADRGRHRPPHPACAPASLCPAAGAGERRADEAAPTPPAPG